MTLAPPHPGHAGTQPGPATPVVTAVLVLHDGEAWLPVVLDSVAAQSRAPDRLIAVDTGSRDGSADLVRSHEGLRRAVGDVRVVDLPRDASFGAAVAAAAEDVGAQPGASLPGSSAHWLWLLHDDSAAAPLTLTRLLDAARRSPSVGIAGPKLVQWDDPGRLLEVGQQLTRSGRRAGGPQPGELDQGQHDHRSDVLAVGSSGLLVRQDVYATLRGFDPAFRRSGDDLDLCWRAQLAGHRVVVVPTATVRHAAASASGLRAGAPSPARARRRDRRVTRLVALARCPLLLAPLLALWVCLAAVGSALTLLLLKRPRRAWYELADLGVLPAAWRTLGSRWRARGTRRVRRRDLTGLFVPRSAAVRSTVDAFHDAVAFEGSSRRSRPSGPASAEDSETGPVAEEAQELQVTPATWPQRVVRHPGFLAVLAASVVAGCSFRTLLLHGALGPGGTGLAGGELLPVRADAAGLWHAWVDAWHGSGLGTSGSLQPPYVPVLAGAAWLVAHLPLVHVSAFPAGTALAWLLLAAAPLSAWSAYLAARLLTGGRWPRAWAALAWASLATVSSGADAGRIGAVVGHVLLPLALAGVGYAARRRSTAPVTFGAALALAVLCAIDPPLGALALVLAALLLLLGHGTARLRGLILFAVPLTLLGPWLQQCLHRPGLLLTGPGLQAWGGSVVPDWQAALLHVDGTSPLSLYAGAALVLAGVVGLLRRGDTARLSTALGALAVSGTAAALAAPHLVLARGPSPVRPWAGTAIDVAALAWLAAAVLGSSGLVARVRGARRHWRAVLAAPVLAVAVAGAVGAALLAAWSPVAGLSAPPRLPGIAAEQLRVPLAGRVLSVSVPSSGSSSGSQGGAAISYQVVGQEPGAVARTLPVATPRADPLLARTVRALVSPETIAGAPGSSPAGELSDLGVGFVSVPGADPTLSARLDATAGLVRLGTAGGETLWRVLPRTGAAGAVVPSSRARLETRSGHLLAGVPVTGSHAATTTLLPAGPSGRRLVVAEPQGWVATAQVRVDGARLQPLTGQVQPTYALPAGAGRLSVRVLPTHAVWLRVQLVVLALTVFLAVPFGNRRSRRPW